MTLTLRSSVFWIAFLFLLLLSLGVHFFASGLASRRLETEIEARTKIDLEATARLAAEHVLSAGALDPSLVDERCKVIGRLTETRITWVAADGSVLGDSDVMPVRLDNHLSRPEVAEAMRGRVGFARRWSRSLGESYLYVAVPVDLPDESRAVIRSALTEASLARHLDAFQAGLWLAVPVGVSIAFLLAWMLTRPVLRFLRQIRKGSIRVSRYDLDYRIPVPALRTAGETATAFNRMIERIRDRFQRMEIERRDNQTLLASMGEGVLAVDGAERIVVMNRAARDALQLGAADSVGRTLPEAIRNPDLLRIVRRALESPGLVQGTVRIAEPEERFLSASGSSWMDPDRGEIGALLVLTDVTRMKKLEDLRRDFVANVSHELRTPITSIRGFAETLRDSDDIPAEDRKRFYEIVARESTRLHEMLEDLLVLARIEKDADGGAIAKARSSIRQVLERASTALAREAESRSMEIRIDCPEDLVADVHEPLLEQAVTNLVGNALRYSDTGKCVSVEGRTLGRETVIAVEDQGWGIPAEHLPRVFERFYRVSQSRARRTGGTGLGLAIVKHITQAHGGFVTVTSRMGEGSRFEIHLPPGGPPSEGEEEET